MCVCVCLERILAKGKGRFKRLGEGTARMLVSREVEMKTQSSVQKESGRDVGGGLGGIGFQSQGCLGQQGRRSTTSPDPTLISGTTGKVRGVESQPLPGLSIWFVDF